MQFGQFIALSSIAAYRKLSPYRLPIHSVAVQRSCGNQFLRLAAPCCVADISYTRKSANSSSLRQISRVAYTSRQRSFIWDVDKIGRSPSWRKSEERFFSSLTVSSCQECTDVGKEVNSAYSTWRLSFYHMSDFVWMKVLFVIGRHYVSAAIRMLEWGRGGGCPVSLLGFSFYLT